MRCSVLASVVAIAVAAADGHLAYNKDRKHHPCLKLKQENVLLEEASGEKIVWKPGRITALIF